MLCYIYSKVHIGHYLCHSIYIIVFRRYYCWVYFYLMVKSRKSFAKIGSRLQIAFTFLFTEIFNHPSLRPLASSDHPVYFILSNFPIPVLFMTPHLFVTQEYPVMKLLSFTILASSIIASAIHCLQLRHNPRHKFCEMN